MASTLWKTRAIALAAVVAVALLVAACGGSAPQSSGQPTATSNATGATATPRDTGLNACSLLTRDEVSAVMGEVSDGALANDPPSSTCRWYSASAVDQVQVQVGLYTVSVPHDVASYYDAFSGTAVDGIGEKAKWVESIGTLEVLQGNYDLSISVTRSISVTEADQQRVSKALALEAVARLP